MGRVTRKDLNRHKKNALLELANKHDFGFNAKKSMTKKLLVEKIFKSRKFKEIKDSIPQAEKRKFSAKQLAAQQRFRDMAKQKKTETRVVVDSLEEEIVGEVVSHTIAPEEVIEVQKVKKDVEVSKKPLPVPEFNINQLSSDGGDVNNFELPLVTENEEPLTPELTEQQKLVMDLTSFLGEDGANKEIVDILNARRQQLQGGLESSVEEVKSPEVVEQIIETTGVPEPQIQVAVLDLPEAKNEDFGTLNQDRMRADLNKINKGDMISFLSLRGRKISGSKQNLISRVLLEDAQEVRDFLDVKVPQREQVRLEQQVKSNKSGNPADAFF